MKPFNKIAVPHAGRPPPVCQQSPLRARPTKARFQHEAGGDQERRSKKLPFQYSRDHSNPLSRSIESRFDFLIEVLPMFRELTDRAREFEQHTAGLASTERRVKPFRDKYVPMPARSVA
jgi:hypothetical protein